MPDAMNFRCSVPMATRPNQNNNKGRIQSIGKKTGENTIQMKLYYKNDSNEELYELFHINVTYLKRKRDTYLRETQCGICNRKSVRDIIYPTKMTTKIYLQHYIVVNYPPLSLTILYK